MFDRSRGGENALLLQPHAPGRFDEAVLQEFEELARSAGARIVGTLNARVERPNPALLIGTGKAVYDQAFLLFMLPHSLVAVSLVTALFTRMSISAAENR